jgi:hypothetical protein
MRTRCRPIATISLTTLAVVVAVVAAGCTSPAGVTPEAPVRAAPPQVHELDWEERYPATGSEQLVFTVRSLEVTEEGWSAEIGIENRTGIGWELPEPAQAFERAFGLMLFETADLAELERLNEAGDLPPPRRARRYVPPLATFLAAGESWRGRISAPGALPGGRFVRVVFGPLRAIDDPPEGAEPQVVWITDRSQQLDGR